MCGITGFFGTGDTQILDAMTDSLSHRGPDARGTWVDVEKTVFLGHRRLSIVDLATGQQPMISVDENIVIIFNGEIYNHEDLRTELVKKGHSFKTDHSDTETLINSYIQWGPDFVSRLNGMWAFVIYDKKNGLLFCSRDRFGEKPFFYTFQNGVFAFASELTAFKHHTVLKREISKKALQKYFAYGYIPAPNSIYENIYKLPAGNSLIFSVKDKSFKINKYWDFKIEPFEHLPRNPEREWGEELQFLLDRAVKRRLMADVPLGVFLSGGVDSSAIAALAARHVEQDSLQTFSIGFDEASFDETIYARQVAKHIGCAHHLDILSIDKALEILPSVLERLDEPMADSSLTPTFLLSKFTKKYVTVALSGDGGDELFAGYDPFQALPIAAMYAKFIPKSMHAKFEKTMLNMPVSLRNMSLDFKLKRTLRGLGFEKKFWLPTWMAPLSPSELSELFNEPLQIDELFSEALDQWNNCDQPSLVDKALQYYTKLYLQDDILVKADRASMMNGLEVRAPFLDIELVDFVRKIPGEYKLRNGKRKYILKKALKNVIPDNIINRSKKGFGAPIGKWFQNQSITINMNQDLKLNQKFIDKKVNDHINKVSNDGTFLWALRTLNSDNL